MPFTMTYNSGESGDTTLGWFGVYSGYTTENARKKFAPFSTSNIKSYSTYSNRYKFEVSASDGSQTYLKFAGFTRPVLSGFSCTLGSSNNDFVGTAACVKGNTSYTITLTENDKANKYSQIYVLAAATGVRTDQNDGRTTATITITYKDNNNNTYNSSKVINLFAWYENFIPNNPTSGVEGISVERISKAFTTNKDSDSEYRTAYEYVIPVDNTKTIESISFVSPESSPAYALTYEVGIFAISGKKASVGEASYIKAYVDGVGYTSITEALKAISTSTSKTIKLNSNITSSDGTGDKDGININVEGVTIDTNGYTIGVPVTISSNNFKLTDSKETDKGSVSGAVTINSNISGTYVDNVDITGTITNNNSTITCSEGTYSFNPATYNTLYSEDPGYRIS